MGTIYRTLIIAFLMLAASCTEKNPNREAEQVLDNRKFQGARRIL